MLSLLDCQEYADIAFLINREIICANHAILAVRSEYFHAMFYWSGRREQQHQLYKPKHITLEFIVCHTSDPVIVHGLHDLKAGPNLLVEIIQLVAGVPFGNNINRVARVSKKVTKRRGEDEREAGSNSCISVNVHRMDIAKFMFFL